MSEESASPARPRIWQLALVLNVFFPPAGYAYVGAWRTAGAFAAAVLVGMVGLTEWTVAYPPGMYGLGVAGVVVLALSLAVALGVHAAWMAEDSDYKTGSRLRHAILYGATSVAVLLMSQLFRAYWPHAFYSYGTESMSPTLHDGDILAVQGARASCNGAEPRPGEVALYRHGRGSEVYMHRVVAGPGQSVAMKAGVLSVDGRRVVQQGVSEQPIEFARRPALIIEETLASGARYRTLDLGPDGVFDEVAETRVPANSWYLLGDNRDNAADSRVSGPVSGREICGVAFRIITSQDRGHVGKKP